MNGRLNGRIILVEGNICVGKSTLSSTLEKCFGKAKAYIEPALDNPYLAKYYNNPKKYALVMQLYLLRERFHTYIEALKLSEKGEIVILDRSIFSDFVFAKKNFDDGNISKEGFNFYLAVRKSLLIDLPLPDCVVYLECSPEECLDRINNLRGRDCESGIPLCYLKGLDACYEELLVELESKCPIMRLNWEKFGDSERVSRDIQELLKSRKIEELSDEIVKLLYDEKELSKREERIESRIGQYN